MQRIALVFLGAAVFGGCWGHVRSTTETDEKGNRVATYESVRRGLGVGREDPPTTIASANAMNAYAHVGAQCIGAACAKGYFPYGVYGGRPLIGGVPMALVPVARSNYAVAGGVVAGRMTPTSAPLPPANLPLPPQVDPPPGGGRVADRPPESPPPAPPAPPPAEASPCQKRMGELEGELATLSRKINAELAKPKPYPGTLRGYFQNGLRLLDDGEQACVGDRAAIAHLRSKRAGFMAALRYLPQP